MKKIEEIIEMMREINPDIKMDDAFKKSLKNKLEITSFAKLKNTKNKKINIAKKGFFSFKKTNKNIFEKPKFNFIKLLSPLFIGAFAVFGFVNFYGNDLFINNGKNLNNNFKYEVEKVEEETFKDSLSTEGFSPLKKVEETNNNSTIIPFNKGNEQVISEEIKKVNIQKQEKKVIKKEVTKKQKKLPKTGGGGNEIISESKKKKIIKDNSLKTTKINLEVQETKIIKKENNSTNTEIIDLLGDEQNIKNNFKTETLSDVNGQSSSDYIQKDFDNMDFQEPIVPEADSITETTELTNSIDYFLQFCQNKKGIIKNDICEYENKKCSRKDFENKKCDEK